MTQDASPTQNLADVFLKQADRLTNRQALLKKDAATGVFSAVTWLEWKQSVVQTSVSLESASISVGDRVAIMSENRPEWTYVDLASLGLGAVVVPIYPTLALPEVLYILRHSETKMLFISNAEMALQIQAESATECPHLKRIVVFKDIQELGLGTMLPWKTFLAEARVLPSAEGEFRVRAGRVQPDDIATIIYTSGTTGPQKGVMLTHRNFMENARMAREYIHITEKDVALSFLPLSHVFERLAGYYFMIAAGATIAYAESIQSVPEDIKIVRPTVAAAVPRFYEKVHAKIMEQVRNKSAAAQSLFTWAIQSGRRYEDARKEGAIPFGIQASYFFANRLH